MGLVKFGSVRAQLLIFAPVFLWLPCAIAGYGGGTGTPEDPYLIYTAEQLNQIGLNNDDWGKQFALMADIDLSGFSDDEFNLIGDQATAFTGVFDGRGHTISNFTYSVSGEGVIALFRYVSGSSAEIKNLHLEDPNVSAILSITAALVASLKGGTVSGCGVTGGSVYSVTSIVGGLVGSNEGGVISNCYAVTDVNGDQTIGGLVGAHDGATTINSFAAGRVNPTAGNAGALVGEGTSGDYFGCFWDRSVNPDLNGIGDVIGSGPSEVIGETTANMKTASTFISHGWDMVTSGHVGEQKIWRMCEDAVYYPRLNVEFGVGDFVCPDGVDEFDLAELASEWILEQFDVDVDLNNDTRVDFRDWAILAGDEETDIEDVALFVEFWLARGMNNLTTDIAPYPPDGIVNLRDFAAFAENWRRGD